MKDGRENKSEKLTVWNDDGLRRNTEISKTDTHGVVVQHDGIKWYRIQAEHEQKTIVAHATIGENPPASTQPPEAPGKQGRDTAQGKENQQKIWVVLHDGKMKLSSVKPSDTDEGIRFVVWIDRQETGEKANLRIHGPRPLTCDMEMMRKLMHVKKKHLICGNIFYKKIFQGAFMGKRFRKISFSK